MTQPAPGRKSALLGLSAMAFLVLGMLSPAAHAQVPGVDIPSVDLPGSGGGSDSDGGSQNDGGGGSGVVGGVVDTVTDTTEKTTDPVGGVVEDTGGAVGSDPIEQAGKTISNTGKDAGETLNEAANGIGQTVDNTTGGLVNPDLLVGDPRDPKSKGSRGNDGPSANQSGSGGPREAVKGDRFGLGAQRDGATSKRGALRAAEAKSRRESVILTNASASAPPRETFITQLADAAVEATKKLAFPLGLALMVGAFLMVQGRIDRKDAKLVLAPISSEQDLLSFQ
jgi:hypothetical protein